MGMLVLPATTLLTGRMSPRLMGRGTRGDLRLSRDLLVSWTAIAQWEHLLRSVQPGISMHHPSVYPSFCSFVAISPSATRTSIFHRSITALYPLFSADVTGLVIVSSTARSRHFVLHRFRFLSYTITSSSSVFSIINM